MKTIPAFQRDCLLIIAGLEPASGPEIRSEIDAYYPDTVPDGRLYPALDRLYRRGYIDKGERDGRTNEYRLTVQGRTAITTHLDWLDRHPDIGR